VKVTTVSAEISPGTMRTTAVSVAASKLISRSSGKLDTLTNVVSAGGNSVMVAVPSGS
jgi:hypothetical protein